jgi:hypothetical protein
MRVPGAHSVASCMVASAELVAVVAGGGIRAGMWLRPGWLVAAPGLTAQLEVGW